MSAFCTAADIAALLQIEVSEYDASVQRAILEASAAIQNYCQQTLELVEDDVVSYVYVRGDKILLPELPVVEISEVVEDGETLTEADDYVLADHGILHRVGQDWAGDTAIIQITYSHGHESLPDDIVAVATRAAARAYQAGLRAAETAGVPGVSATSLGDYSVSYGAEGSSGGQGVLGASAAPILLRSEKEILDRYRLR